MRRVMFTGFRRVGTLRPRRLWSPGEALDVEDDVAEELGSHPDFKVLKKPSKKKVQETASEEE